MGRLNPLAGRWFDPTPPRPYAAAFAVWNRVVVCGLFWNLNFGLGVVPEQIFLH